MSFFPLRTLSNLAGRPVWVCKTNTRVSCLDFPGILALYPSSIARENYCFQMIDKIQTTFWTQRELQRQKKHNTTEVRILYTRTLLLCACLQNTKDACDCLHNTTVFVTRTVLECSLMRWLVEKGASSWTIPTDSNQPWPLFNSRISCLFIGSCLLLRMSFKNSF